MVQILLSIHIFGRSSKGSKLKIWAKKANSDSIIWQTPETDYWKSFLKKLINEHFKETQSKIASKILENYNVEVKKFMQICPKEMLDKLLNPLSSKTKVLRAV